MFFPWKKQLKSTGKTQKSCVLDLVHNENGLTTSIMYLMKQDNVYPPLEFKEKVCNLLKGFRQTIQQQKVDFGGSLNERKNPLSFSGYM